MLWKERYSLGVTLVDEQHRELFKRVEVFMTALRSSTPWDEKVQSVNETLAFMNAYVVEHFRDEEAYQQKIGYPGFDAHRRKHADMIEYVKQISAEYEKTGCSEPLIQQFAGKLMAWLINHVASEDQRIATYAIEKGVAAHES
jgi:hemerythrin